MYDGRSSDILSAPMYRCVCIIRTSSTETSIDLLMAFCMMVFSHWALTFIQAILNNGEGIIVSRDMFLVELADVRMCNNCPIKRLLFLLDPP